VPGERFHDRDFFGQLNLPPSIAFVHNGEQESFVGFQALKVAAAAQQQMLFHRAFETAVGGFDIAVFHWDWPDGWCVLPIRNGPVVAGTLRCTRALAGWSGGLPDPVCAWRQSCGRSGAPGARTPG
jgi:hypothetical protein